MTPDEFLHDLRREHRRLRFALASVECIGLALSKGVLDLETALDMWGSSPKLRSEPDPFVVELMRADPPRRKHRRAA